MCVMGNIGSYFIMRRLCNVAATLLCTSFLLNTMIYAAFVFDPTALVTSTEMMEMMLMSDGRCRSWY